MANEVWVFKGIKPARLKVDGYRLRILNAIRKGARGIKSDLERTTHTWADPPKFDFVIGLDREGASALVGPVGTDLQVKKFKWLDKGTSIRWALMSDDWVSKTKPGVLDSGPGRGRVVIAGRRAMQARNIGPRPGIAPRGWTEMVAKSHTRKFKRLIEEAIKASARDSF